MTVMLVPFTRGDADEKRPESRRQGRFITTHLDLIGAASSLLPVLIMPDSKADRLVSMIEEEPEENTSDSEETINNDDAFGAKLREETDSSVGELREAPLPPPPPPSFYNPYQFQPTPEGTPQPLLVVCEDPNYCPPPGYGPPGGELVSFTPSYDGIRQYGVKRGSTSAPATPLPTMPPTPPPTYRPLTTRKTIKKYGYNPSKSNPTIWRQQVLKVRKPQKKEPTPAKKEVKEALPEEAIDVEDINQMSIQELREFVKSGMMTKGKPSEEKKEEPEIVKESDKLTFLHQMAELKKIEDMHKVEEEKEDNTDMMMHFKKKELDDMTLVSKEMMVMKAGLPEEQAEDIKEGITVEELIALENNMSVEEMIATKHDMSVLEVTKMKEEMSVEDLEAEHKELEVEEIVALKSDLTMVEMVAMKNDVAVEEIEKVIEEIEMADIMSMQDGMTKKEVQLVAKDILSVPEVVAIKTSGLNNQGIKIASEEPIMGMEGLREMADHMQVVNIDGSLKDGVKFLEVFENPAMMATSEPPPTTPTPAGPVSMKELMMQRVRDKEDTKHRMKMRPKKEKEQMKIQMRPMKEEMKMKMRPMRVKVRKPTRPSFSSSSGFDDTDIEDAVDQAFGLKNNVASQQLILEPTPAVPGRPSSEDSVRRRPNNQPTMFQRNRIRNRFNEFVDKSTASPVILLDNIKTEDLQSEENSGEFDYPIYDALPPPTMDIKVINDVDEETSSNANNNANNNNNEVFLGNSHANLMNSDTFMTIPQTMEQENFMTMNQGTNMKENKQSFTDLNKDVFGKDDSFMAFMHSDIMENQGLHIGGNKEAMPIFTNFPMMKPGQFVQPLPTDPPADEAEYPDYEDYSQQRPEPVQAFEPQIPDVISREPEQPQTFFNSQRPESIGLISPVTTKAPKMNNQLDQFVGLFRDENELEESDRLVRRPNPRPFINLGVSSGGNSYHPNHKPTVSPARPTIPTTPFTARTRNTVVPFSYARNRLPESNNKKPGFYAGHPFSGFKEDTNNMPLYRELPAAPYSQGLSDVQIKPFVELGNEYKENATPRTTEININIKNDYNDDTIKGVSFYQNYGQHDDRPYIRRPTASPDLAEIVEEEIEADQQDNSQEAVRVERRPQDVRFGSMNFALPARGGFPDRPAEEAAKYIRRPYSSNLRSSPDQKKKKTTLDSRPVSDVYPNHPVSSIFPNRPVSDIFRDLPQTLEHPEFPSYFPGQDGFAAEESNPKMPSFDKFVQESEKYLNNPFGSDFIKMEIDQSKFKTNQTKPSVHHIPLDVHGFPNVPKYDPENDIVSAKPSDRPKRKLYRPPPVMTKYAPPKYRKSSEEKPIKNISEELAAIGRSGFPFSVMKEAMTTLPSAIQNLPLFMEKLMSNQADWVSRAWQGERDEAAAAARSFDSIES